MSANSKIEWCDHTFNPWEGCQKVGPGCDNCYAEKRNARFAGGQAINWGPGAPRRRTSASNWNKPRAWNVQADAFFAQHGRRQRVFCASLADVFDNEVDREWRDDLATLILDTPNLDWLLLTKRIGNAGAMMGEMFLDGPPDNLWLGATIVNREEMLRDGPKLKLVPALVHFWSCEPLLGDLGEIPSELIPHWIIAGGESGPGARPMHPDWARSLRDECEAAGVPFLFKQWGHWQIASRANGHYDSDMASNSAVWLDHDGTTAKPSSLGMTNAYAMAPVGKKAAGRLLDGRTWDGVPA